ncbi:MAG: CooT family nickel-binding protein [Desulfuromonadales bacterium]|nr:CooT family nickel-binding protein [Desulfuromonadales bacterium]
MCIDHGPFLLVQGEEEESLAEINAILVLADGLKLIDVYGKSRTVVGMISEIDLLNRRIVLG